MFRARICHGRVELEEPLPESWEGQEVKIEPLTPDDPLPDLEQWLTQLHALGPMEYEPGERERIESEMKQVDEISKREVARQMGLDRSRGTP